MLRRTLFLIAPRPLFQFGTHACFSASAAAGHKVYDIVISGGGLIGLTTAAALSKNPVFENHSILLIENAPKKFYTTNKTYSNRVSSITNGTKSLLTKIGAWKHIEETRFCTVKDMKVWGDYSPTYIQFAEKFNPMDIAYIVENDVILNAVLKALEGSKNVEIMYETNIKNIDLSKANFDNGLPEITTSRNDNLQCNLLIGADGFNSSVRKAMGVEYVTWDYNNVGIVATLHLASIPGQINDTSWQRFLPKGPIAILPLTPTLSSLVWSTTKKEADILMNLPQESFVDAINKSLSSRPTKDQTVESSAELLGRLMSVLNVSTKQPEIFPPTVIDIEKGSRASFPLGFGHAVSYVSPKAVLVGDSAHRVHPLAGQGVNLGFSDIQNLELALEEGLKNGRVLGHISDLSIYEQRSLRNNFPFLVFIDLTYRVYTSQYPILKALGNAGLMLASSLDPLKSLMKTVASGSKR